MRTMTNFTSAVGALSAPFGPGPAGGVTFTAGGGWAGKSIVPMRSTASTRTNRGTSRYGASMTPSGSATSASLVTCGAQGRECGAVALRRALKKGPPLLDSGSCVGLVIDGVPSSSTYSYSACRCARPCAGFSVVFKFLLNLFITTPMTTPAFAGVGRDSGEVKKKKVVTTITQIHM